MRAIEALLEDFLPKNDIPHVNLMGHLESDRVEDIQAGFFP